MTAKSLKKEISRIVKEYDWLWEDVTEWIFPGRCPVCDSAVMYGNKRGVCRECMKKVPVIRGARCFMCGKPVEDAKQELCRDCRKYGKLHYFDRGFALCTYDEIMKKSIYRFKYQHRAEYGRVYGRWMAEQFGAAIRRAGVEGIIPVPLHRERERERGYNQAAIMAKELGRKTGIPVYDKLVIRQKYTRPMKMLDILERQNNLKKAFKLRGNDVKLKITIVIDDIYTTGSTIDAVAKVLREAGVSCVYFITLAVGEG